MPRKTQPLPVTAIVVALVSVQLGQALSGPAGQARDLGQRAHQGLQQPRVMDISRRQLRCQRQTALVDDDVMLATELSPERNYYHKQLTRVAMPACTIDHQIDLDSFFQSVEISQS